MDTFFFSSPHTCHVMLATSELKMHSVLLSLAGANPCTYEKHHWLGFEDSCKSHYLILSWTLLKVWPPAVDLEILLNFIPLWWLFLISVLVTSIQTFRSYSSSPRHQLFSHNVLKTTTHLLWNSEDTEDFALWSSLCFLELENLVIDSILWRACVSEDAEK